MSVNQFNAMGQQYGQSLVDFPEARTAELSAILSRADAKAGEKILDFAAGTGFVTFPLSKMVGVSGSITAVDISEVQLNQLRQRLEKEGGANISVVHTSDPLLSNIPSGAFDKVTSLGGYHHVENQVEVTRSLYRVLKPGGKAVIFDFQDSCATQRHFDTIVHDHNGVGHRGLFFTPSKWVNICRYLDCQNHQLEFIKLPWRFKTAAHVGQFFKQHHGLDIDAETVGKRIFENFGCQPNPDGTVDVHFEYAIATLHKP